LKSSLACLAAAAVIATGWPGAAPLAQVRLPSLGEALPDDFGPSAERRLGEQIMREIRRDPAYLDDPVLLDYVQSLWTPLLATAVRRGEIGADTADAFAWQVFLVRDRSVNAFALPGGYVGVHLGLIAMTTLRDELASVLAHEMAHVTQRHIARGVANAQQQSLVGLAAMILGALAASRTGSADAVQAVIAGSQAAVVQGQLNYSRDMEREADRVGWGVFTGAGFAPAGMASMFEKLDQASRLFDNNAYPYLRTHPLTVERIGEARSRLEATDARNTPPANVFEHALMRTRARVLMDTSQPALRRAQAMQPAPDSAAAERLAVAYANAMASLLLREPAAAERALAEARQLLRTSPLRDAQDRRAERALVLLEAEWLVAAGDPAAALRRLDAEPEASRPWLLQRAQAALAASRAGAPPEALRRSVEALQTWVTEHRQDALAWSLLAQCASQAGQPLRAIRADAEAQAAIGDLPGAIDRLRAGQRLGRSDGGGDFVELSVIDLRLRELEAEQRRRIAEQRGG
jgi:predicted Zn-dependent protease